MTIDTSDYTNTYGRSPKGSGSWVFRIIRLTPNGKPMTTYHYSLQTTYSQAVASVKKNAAYGRAHSIALLS